MLSQLGLIYKNLGRYEKAIENYEQALVIAREVKDRRGEGVALYTLGGAYSTLGRPQKAIEYLELALAIFREVKTRPNEGGALNVLGNTYFRTSRHEKAIEYYEQALALARAVKNRILEGNILDGFGKSYRSLGRLDEAIKSHEQAAFIAREVKAKEKDTYYGKQAVNVYQEMRSNIQGLERETQQSFIKSNENTYRTLADLVISEGRLPEAEQVINMLKQKSISTSSAAIRPMRRKSRKLN